MPLIAAVQLQDGHKIAADFCVVGSGPAGLTVAHALAAAGLSVCLIESGGDAPDEEIHALNEFESVGHPIREGFVNRLRMLGGTSNLWAGRCMALERIDFETRAHVGASGWAVTYEEIKPYLAQAAEVMKLPRGGAMSNGPTAPSGEDAAAGAPLAGFAGKIALWAKSPPNFWRIYGVPLRTNAACRILTGLTLTGLVLNEAGTRVERAIAQLSRLSDPRVKPPSEHTGMTIHASRYVLAMGGIETTRTMLLAARDNSHAAWPREPLGRCYMDHPRAVQGSIRLNKGVDFADYLRHPVADGMVQTCLGISLHDQRREGLLNPFFHIEPAVSDVTAEGYDFAIHVLKRILRRGHVGRRMDLSNRTKVRDLIYQLTPGEVLPHSLYRIYFDLRNLVRSHKSDLVIVNHCEQVPNPDSRIMLGDRADRFDNPLPRLDWRIHPREIESIKYFHRMLKDRLEAHRLGRLVTDPEDFDTSMFFDSSHHMGGTRMSTAPRDGVVDADLKVHGLSNLFLCSSSVFPTGGSASPTWTLVALALRLADHLKARRGSC